MEESGCAAAELRTIACNDPHCVKNDGLSFEQEHVIVISEARSAVWNCREMCRETCGLGTNWGCVYAYGPPRNTPPTATAEIQFIDVLSNASVVPEVIACTDEACSSPIVPSGTGPNEGVQLVLPSGFRGFFRITHPSYLPVRLQLMQPFFGHRVHVVPLPHRVTSVVAIESMLKTKLDPERGMVWVMGFDCRADRAVGVSFTLGAGDEQTRSAYFLGAGLSTTATRTDVTGAMLAANVPVGDFSVTMNDPDSGRMLGLAPSRVEAGVVTFVWPVPSPGL
jgi:hypothetical protein